MKVKKILVSHTRIHQDNVEADKVAAENEEAKKDRAVKKATKKINEQVEKTTLGDVFGNLKEELEKRLPAWLDENLPANRLTCEYFLPMVANALIHEKEPVGNNVAVRY